MLNQANSFDQKYSKTVILWTIITIKKLLILIYLKIPFAIVMAKLTFQQL